MKWHMLCISWRTSWRGVQCWQQFFCPEHLQVIYGWPARPNDFSLCCYGNSEIFVLPFLRFFFFGFFFKCFPLIPIVGVWEIQGHNHNFSLDLFHWWIISPLLKLMTISLLLGKNDFMSTGFSPWQFSPWATLDPFHPRCLHPFPEAAGACSYHCGNKGGYVHWHRSSAAPTLRPQTPGTLKDLVWSFWA